MNHITLSGTDITTIPIALGTAYFGTTIDEQQSFRLMDNFTDRGANLIDTAECYANWLGMGKSLSEKTIGKWMKQKCNRHRVIISTKGAFPRDDVTFASRLSEKDIMEDVEGSLKNLCTDYIDIYFLHRDDESLSVGPIMETLHKLVASGKVRSIGLSNWSPHRIAEALRYCRQNNLTNITLSQIQYGIADPNPDEIDPTTRYMTKEAYEFYSQNKLNVLSFSSQSCGYFFKRLSDGSPADNKVYNSTANRKRFYALWKLSEKYGVSVGSIIISALCSNPMFTTVPIIGCSKCSHMNDSLNGLELALSSEERDALIKKA